MEYFISYFYVKKEETGFGYIVTEIYKTINCQTIEDIREEIKNRNEFDNVVILSLQKLGD